MATTEDILIAFAAGFIGVYVIRFILFKTLFDTLTGSGGGMEGKLGKARRALKTLDLF